MMKETLKRDLNKTYLIINSEDVQYEETYETEMIIKNEPQTILPLHVLRVDGTLQLFYDISSKQTLKACSERVKLRAETIRNLFRTIEELEDNIRNYLLNMGSVILDLEHIYTKEGKFFFCYCPWEERDVLVSFREMLEEILGNLDYHDTEGVELAYHLYQSACRGNFHIGEILEEHCKKENISTEEEGCANDFLPKEEELPEEFLRDLPDEEEIEPKKKRGILNRILQFFLKKEEPKQDREESILHEEMYQGFFQDGRQEVPYTEVLIPPESNTVLLENMPAGRWKLRPLIPGYEEFSVEGDSFLVGKKRDSVDGFIGRDTISRIHSRLFVKQERLFIADANSTNGTYVNGVAIEPGEDVEIFAGDRILFADVGYECYNSL